MRLIEKRIYVTKVKWLNWVYPFTKYTYYLCDYSYGQFLILQNDLPAFYFCAFNEEGVVKESVEEFLKNASNLEDVLLSKLISFGYKGVSINSSNSFIKMSEEIVAFDLLEIVDLVIN